MTTAMGAGYQGNNNAGLRQTGANTFNNRSHPGREFTGTIACNDDIKIQGSIYLGCDAYYPLSYQKIGQKKYCFARKSQITQCNATKHAVRANYKMPYARISFGIAFEL